MDKECTKCKEVKSLDEFSKKAWWCKKCKNQYAREYRIKNSEMLKEKEKEKYRKRVEADPEWNKKEYLKRRDSDTYKKYRQKYYEENKENIAQRKREWNKKNADHVRERTKRYNQENKEHLDQKRKEYRIKNKEVIAEKRKIYRNGKLKNDPAYKLKNLVARLVRHALKRNDGSKAGESVLQYLPYTMDELKEHLEKQFQEGMTWDNHTTEGWHIDHIIPQSKLIYDSMDHPNFQKCWALENLQPLWAKENISKSNKIL